jgi:hypothetical protein
MGHAKPECIALFSAVIAFAVVFAILLLKK